MGIPTRCRRDGSGGLVLTSKPGDVIEKNGKRYIVTDKHPRLVVDTGREVIPDPAYKGGPTFAHVPEQYLLIVPVDEYDSFMKNYDRRLNASDVDYMKRLEEQTEELQKRGYAIINGKKVKI